MDMLSSLINSVFQLAIFALIPFLVWVIKRRRELSFFEYVGITRPKFQGKWRLFVILLAGYIFVYFFDSSSILPAGVIHEINNSAEVASSPFAGLGFSAIIPILLMSFIQNGLCEELFFRGFIGKQLIKRCGLSVGIILQAVIFALIHNVMFMGVVQNIAFHIVLFATVTIMSSILCLFNERFFNGSIWISVLIHGIGNFISYMLVAFNMR